MAWKIEIDRDVKRDIDKTNRHDARHILKLFYERLAHVDDPRSIGDPLKGTRLGEFWKYSVGDYRIIAKIEDGILLIMVVKPSLRGR